MINRRDLFKTSLASCLYLGGCQSQNLLSSKDTQASSSLGKPLDSEIFKIGVGIRTVNPTKLSLCFGHGEAMVHSTVLWDIRVHTIVIEDTNHNRIVLMAWDFLSPHALMVDEIRKYITDKYGIAASNICVNVSHNHSAPPLYEEDASAAPDYFDPDYRKFAIEQIKQSADEAFANMQQATLRYCEYMCTSIGVNRRTPENSAPLFAPNFKEPTDHRVMVISAESTKDSKPIAVIVKYVCHPVTVGPFGLCSDYPGIMRDFIEKRHPGTKAVFLQGCTGNIRVQMMDKYATKFPWIDPVETAEKLGRDLGMSVEWALATKGIRMQGPIKANYKIVKLPLKKLSREEYASAINSEDKKWVIWSKHFTQMLDEDKEIQYSRDFRIQTFVFGANSKNQLNIVALQDEPLVEYGLKIEEELLPGKSIVLGYSNERLTYLPTAKQLQEGGYESYNYRRVMLAGPYDAAAESMVIKTVMELVKK